MIIVAMQGCKVHDRMQTQNRTAGVEILAAHFAEPSHWNQCCSSSSWLPKFCRDRCPPRRNTCWNRLFVMKALRLFALFLFLLAPFPVGSRLAETIFMFSIIGKEPAMDKCLTQTILVQCAFAGLQACGARPTIPVQQSNAKTEGR